jgi:hypothetical protein
MTPKQWEALANFIKSEAKYAAGEVVNYNDCGEALRRMEIEQEARDLFVGEAS